MPVVPRFHSVKEINKPPADRVHHNNTACPSGRDIPPDERLAGNGGYRLCDDCIKLKKQGR